MNANALKEASMTWRIFQGICIVFVLIICTLVLADLYAPYGPCDICGERTWNKQTHWRGHKYCDRCFSECNLIAQEEMNKCNDGMTGKYAVYCPEWGDVITMVLESRI